MAPGSRKCADKLKAKAVMSERKAGCSVANCRTMLDKNTSKLLVVTLGSPGENHHEAMPIISEKKE